LPCRLLSCHALAMLSVISCLLPSMFCLLILNFGTGPVILILRLNVVNHPLQPPY
jgi:hypothetical protein